MVAQAISFERVEHPPKRERREEEHERLRAVEVRELNENHGESGQRRGEQPRRRAKQPPAQQKHEPRRGGVDERGDDPSGQREVVQADAVHKQPHRKANGDQQIDENAA